MIKVLDEIFIPLGYKRKGNNWVNNHGAELSKIVNLQKSSHSNSFYINYGFVLKSLPLGILHMHISNRLGSNDSIEQKKITDLLDLESDVPCDLRLSELRTLVTNKVAISIQAINTETDILNDLSALPHLNGIPSIVKDYFGLA